MKARTIIALLTLLLAGGAAAWKFIPHTLSHDECSDVYRHFADMQMEGVRVTYVRDKVVNDTLRLPVTLLQAESDAGWAILDSLFGLTADRSKLINDITIPDEVKQMFLRNSPRFTYQRSHRETPEQKIAPMDLCPEDVSVYIFPDLRCVTIYETGIEKEEAQVNNQNLRELKERSRSQQCKATCDAALDHIDSIDASRNKKNIEQ